MRNKFQQMKLVSAQNVPKEQLADMDQRMNVIYQREPEVYRKLEYLELRHRILVYFLLTERRLRLWTDKFGTATEVEDMNTDYQVTLRRLMNNS